MSPAEGRRGAAKYWLDKAGRSLASAQRGDYLDFVSFAAEEVADAMPRVEELVAVLEKLVATAEA